VKYGSSDNVYGNAGILLGNAMAAKFDDDCVGLFSGVSNNIDNSDAAITLLNIFDAVEKLRTNNAPTVNGKYFGVFHPKQIWGSYGLINAIDGIAFDKTNEFISNGYVGTIAGVEIFTTPEISADDGANSDEATACIFSPQAFGVGYKEIGGGGFITIEEQRDASKALTELICNGYYNVGELVDEYACTITTQAHA
jgi:N4-gp56 family major capsid protein